MGRTHSDEAGSVTRWIPGLQRGVTSKPSQVLWEHYFEPLARIAKARLRDGAGPGPVTARTLQSRPSSASAVT